MYGIKIIKCDYCGEMKAVRIQLKDYVYKRRLKESKGVVYFCGYNCMSKAERENTERYVKRVK